MSKYLTQLRVIRANIMKFLGTGMINGTSYQSGYNFMKFMGRESVVRFGAKFEEVWTNQLMHIEVVKVFCALIDMLMVLGVGCATSFGPSKDDGWLGLEQPYSRPARPDQAISIYVPGICRRNMRIMGW